MYFSVLQSQDNLRGWVAEPAGLSAGAEEARAGGSVAIWLVRREGEAGVPSGELGSADAAAARSEPSEWTPRKDGVCGSAGRPEKAEAVKSLVTDQDASRNRELYLPVSSNCSAVESSEDR